MTGMICELFSMNSIFSEINKLFKYSTFSFWIFLSVELILRYFIVFLAASAFAGGIAVVKIKPLADDLTKSQIVLFAAI